MIYHFRKICKIMNCSMALSKHLLKLINYVTWTKIGWTGSQQTSLHGFFTGHTRGSTDRSQWASSIPFSLLVNNPEYRRKHPICKNACIENARYFLLYTTVYFFFFSSSFLFFSFLVLFLLVIYVHSRVSRSVVTIVVSIFSSQVYTHENAPESWIWHRGFISLVCRHTLCHF